MPTPVSIAGRNLGCDRGVYLEDPCNGHGPAEFVRGRREVAALAMRLEVELQRRRTIGAGGAGEPFRFSHAVRGGAACFGSTPLGSFSPRALGFALFVPPTERGIDAIRRHFAALRQPSRIVLCEGAVPLAAHRLLERAGFAREHEVGVGWALGAEASARLVRSVRVSSPDGRRRGVSVERLAGVNAAAFVRISTAGFGLRGRTRFFARSIARLIAAHPRTSVAVLARYDGRPAGSGGLFIHRGAGLLFAGSVTGAHRGRGIQPALIAARVAHGFERGSRTFFAQTAPDGASARNFADAGFRRHAVLALWTLTD